jgi:hypothetical protein
MRLRQAHAILEAATALEASGLGFEMYPFDHDRPDAVQPVADDYMTGFAEFNDPDHPDDQTRTYNIDIKPHPDGCHIEATLVYGYDDDPPCLLYSKASVHQPYDPGETPRLLGLVGAGIAERIADAVRRHEKPYRAAYEERTTA